MPTKYTTKSGKSYSHLNIFERAQIELLLNKGFSIRSIGRELQRHYSTISREIKRNKHQIYLRYFAKSAFLKNLVRQKLKRKITYLKTDKIRKAVEKRLKKGWSPEQIAGRLKLENKGKAITNHESIYKWIYNLRQDLERYLIRARKKRRKRSKRRKQQACHIPNRVSIEKRPVKANKRTQAGHWEADTVYSSREDKTALSVLVERKHRVTMIRKIERKTADLMRAAVVKSLMRFPEELRRTITYDNGFENVQHEKVNKRLKTRSYFCNPYHSWEKGTVENTIGLIRQYLPKKTNFENIDNKKLKAIECSLNNRPRKCLGYLTPLESLSRECCT